MALSPYWKEGGGVKLGPLTVCPQVPTAVYQLWHGFQTDFRTLSSG